MNDCGRAGPYTRGMCRLHYRRWKRHGDPNVTIRNLNHDDGCVVPECTRSYKANGFCHLHLRRWQKYGDPLKGEPVRQNPSCLKCGEPSYSKSLCSVHYQAHRVSIQPACVISGCNNKRRPGGEICGPHWYRWQRTGDPLADRLPAGPPCSFCSHPRRLEFESEILAGYVVLSETARRFGFQMGSLWHHMKEHMAAPTPPRCAACRHPEILVVEELLAGWSDGRFKGAVSLARVARDFGLKEAQLRRHKTMNHAESQFIYTAKRLRAVQQWAA